MSNLTGVRMCSSDSEPQLSFNWSVEAVASVSGAATRPQNLLEVRSALKLVPGLRPREREDLISVINSLGRQLAGGYSRNYGSNLSGISTDPEALDEVLRGLPKRAVGISASSARKIASTARKALRLVGVPLRDGHGRSPLSDDWSEIYRKPGMNLSQRHVVKAFAAWCSENQISPRDVRSATFDEYKPHLMKLRSRERDSKSGRQLFLLLLDTWNSSISPSLGPDAERVDASRSYDGYLYVPGSWCHSFEAEVKKWQWLTQHADLHDPNAPRRVSATTAVSEAKLIKVMASAYCRATGTEPRVIGSIATLVTLDASEKILTFILERASTKQGGRTVNRTAYAYTVAGLILKLAQYWVGRGGAGPAIDGATLLELEDQAWRLGPTEPVADERKYKRIVSARMPIALAENHRTLLRRFLERDLQVEFLRLPHKIFESLPIDDVPTYRQAVELTTAFALAFLTTAPVFPSLAAATHLDRNVSDSNVDGKRVVLVRWTKEEALRGCALDYELMGSTLDLYDRYMRQVRPVLTGATGRYLFPSSESRPRNASVLSRDIKTLCVRHLGVAITASQIRLVVATLVMLGPDGATDRGQQRARRFLGYASKKARDPLFEAVKDWLSGAKLDSGVLAITRRSKPSSHLSLKKAHQDA